VIAAHFQLDLMVIGEMASLVVGWSAPDADPEQRREDGAGMNVEFLAVPSRQ